MSTGAGIEGDWVKPFKIGRYIALVHELLDALERSVKLQSHYARLLNMHDGGERLTFDGSDDWLQRLRLLKSQ